jgi:micrococcal nuclease
MALFAFAGAASSAYCVETAKVLSVEDADVLKVLYKGKVEYVRLAGIEISEPPSDNETIKSALADKRNLEIIISRTGKNKPTIVAEKNRLARLFMKRAVMPGQEVILEIDGRRQDEHNMLLCYVFMPKGKLLNEEIVRTGFARVSDEPYIRYRERLENAYKAARRRNKPYSFK